MSLRITCRICGKKDEAVGNIALRDLSHCLCKEHYNQENIAELKYEDDYEKDIKEYNRIKNKYGLT